MNLHWPCFTVGVLAVSLSFAACDDEGSQILPSTFDSGTGSADAAPTPDATAPLDSPFDTPANVAGAACAPPPPACQGVCALQPATCVNGAWICGGPGFQPVEASCDGFDNDCDGSIDEGVCAACTVSPRIDAELSSMWDIDFDYECNTYLTTLISGPDYTTVVPADGAKAISKYFGNANQNMGYALVDPDPRNRRVVVTYACCETCGCLAKNGVTLLHTCEPSEPGCDCQGQKNCPGFLDAPFLPAGRVDLPIKANGNTVATPNGLAVGPGNVYYVGNFKPETCSTDAACDACDPAHPDVVCKPSRANCCDISPFGRLVRFTLPAPGVEPTWRVVKIIEGEPILGLASGRDGSVYIGTSAGANAGKLHRYDPVSETLTTLATFGGAVYSITQDRKTGDLYLEVFATPKIVRLSESGAPLVLPASVPASPAAQGVLQVGPDRTLYRLQGTVGTPSPIERYQLP